MRKKVCFKLLIISLLSLILIFIDQLTKYLVVNRLDLEANHPVIPKILSFEYLENRGVAFGIMSGKMTLITIVVILVTVFIVYMVFLLEKAIFKSSNLNIKFTLLQVICAFLIAGAIGNLIDRLSLGYVVDFIKFDFINFPTFNVADCYVTVSAILLFIILMFFISEDELEAVKNK